MVWLSQTHDHDCQPHFPSIIPGKRVARSLVLQLVDFPRFEPKSTMTTCSKNSHAVKCLAVLNFDLWTWTKFPSMASWPLTLPHCGLLCTYINKFYFCTASLVPTLPHKCTLLHELCRLTQVIQCSHPSCSVKLSTVHTVSSGREGVKVDGVQRRRAYSYNE